MKNSSFKYNCVLLVTALMWGAGFVFQREGASLLGPFSFNGFRCLLAVFALTPVMLWITLRRTGKQDDGSILLNSHTWVAGSAIGVCLFFALVFQQAGLEYTTAGKAGFITEMGVVFVPLLAFFLGIRPRLNTWIGLLLVMTGLYFLTLSDIEPFNKGDVLEMIGAFMWSIQILVIDRMSGGHNPFALSFIQFFICAMLCIFASMLFETTTLDSIVSAWRPLIYTGVFSSAVAFTLQVIAQQKTPAIYVSMILSLEAVFAALLGVVYLGEKMGFSAILGCIIMLAGILFAQINIFQWFFQRKNYRLKQNRNNL